MNTTPNSNRAHIGIFGRRNAGKSSVINAITGQDLAIVSDVKGTTTDPVLKAMEILPLGPVVVIDTPGLDDEGQLGQLRIKKAYQVLNKTDIAVLVVEATGAMTAEDEMILNRIKDKNIPYIIVYNKSDLLETIPQPLEHSIYVSAVNKLNIDELKDKIAGLAPSDEAKFPIISDLVCPMEFVVLVIPIDSAAPKGRLILPQQQTIRELLELGAVSVCVREFEYAKTIKELGDKVKLVVTDSQAFKQISAETPENITLTSFSILFARHKGNLDSLVHGANALDAIEDGDTILISEGCTHHRQCDDIGTVKLPKWISAYSGKQINFEFTSGTEFPLELSNYKLIVHCGGCMLNEKEMKYRIKCAQDAKIPMTNYGTAIAHMNGILKRSLRVFEK